MRQIAKLLIAAAFASPVLAQNSPVVDSGICTSTSCIFCEPPAHDFPSADCADCGYWYAEVDLLLRWFKPVCASVPVVSIGDPNSRTPGALGQPGTRVVVGGVPPHKFEFPMTPGVQLTLGWNRGGGALGFEIRGFDVAQAKNSQRFDADASGFPFTYLPYQAPDNSFQALPFTIPGVVTGTAEAVGTTKVWGVESNIAAPFPIDRCTSRFFGSFLVGARYLDLRDRVRLTNRLQLVADPSAYAIGEDQFSTHNQFAGPQVGTTVGMSCDRYSIELTSKLAAGITRQERTIEGSPLQQSTVVSPLLLPGPFLALPSNIGTESAQRVTLVPEFGIKTQVAVTANLSLTFGYTLIYWNKVLCPGDQMSPLINITQVQFNGPETGPRDPKPLFVHTDYFTQGMDFGVQFRY